MHFTDSADSLHLLNAMTRYIYILYLVEFTIQTCGVPKHDSDITFLIQEPKRSISGTV